MLLIKKNPKFSRIILNKYLNEIPKKNIDEGLELNLKLISDRFVFIHC